VAVCLVVTLAMASLLPYLAADNSQAIWMPPGPRAQAFEAAESQVGTVEHVGVIAQAADGNILDADDLARLLAFESDVEHQPALAEALRFQGGTLESMESVADYVAIAEAILESRRQQVGPIADALGPIIATGPSELTTPAVESASWAVALLGGARAAPDAPHALVDAVFPELVEVLESGTDHEYKGQAARMFLAVAEAARWSLDTGQLDPQDPGLLALGAAMERTRMFLLSGGSADGQREVVAALASSALAARAALALAPGPLLEASVRQSAYVQGLGGGIEPLAAARLAAASAEVATALLFADGLVSIADPPAAVGLQTMAQEVAAVLASDLPSTERARAVRMLARVFETAIAMGDAGLDMSTPQSNVSYNAYTLALADNASQWANASLPVAAKAQSAADAAQRTAIIIANNEALNASGVFTCQPCFQRQMTMLYSLNMTFGDLAAFLSSGGDAAALDAGARAAAAEVLQVINVTSPFPNHIDLAAAAQVAAALSSLAQSVAADGDSAAAGLFERAPAALLVRFDFPSASTMGNTERLVLLAETAALETASRVLGGGEPPASKAAAALSLSAAVELPSRAAASALDPAVMDALLAHARTLVEALLAVESGPPYPALSARLADAALGTFAAGLTHPEGLLNGTDATLVAPLRGMLAPVYGGLTDSGVDDAMQGAFALQVAVSCRQVMESFDGGLLATFATNRSQAAAALTDAGNGRAQEALRVLLVDGASAPVLPASFPTADSRAARFVANVSAYHANLESQLRQTYGGRAERLLPSGFAAQQGEIAVGSTLVLLRLDGSLDREGLGAREDVLRSMALQRSQSGVSFTAFAYGLMWHDTQVAMDLSVVLFALVMLAVMGIALLWVYRRPFDTAVTLAVLLMTVIWVLGAASLLGMRINPVTVVVPVLLIGMAEDFAVHVVMGYRRERARGLPQRLASRAAMASLAGVLAAATLTNGLSFLSFGGADIALVRDFGFLIALGLLSSFTLSMTFVPAALAWRDRNADARVESPLQDGDGAGPAKPPPRRAERILRGPVRAGLLHPVPGLLVVLLLTGASLVAATGLPTTFSYRDVTAGDLSVVQTTEDAQAAYPVSLQRALIVVQGDVAEPQVFLAIRLVESLAGADPYVVRVGNRASVETVGSYAEGLAARARLSGAAAAGAPGLFAGAFATADANGDGRLTAADNLTRTALSDLFEALRADARGASLVGPDQGGMRLSVITVEVTGAVEHGDAILAALEEDTAPLRDAPAADHLQEVTVTGLPLLNREVMESVQSSGWQSLLITLIVAVVLLSVIFSVALGTRALGALTIAPSLIAVAWTLGVMAAAGLSLNMMTVMIATTTVGMGDLYAIHVAHSYYRKRTAGEGPIEAADSMISEAGAPLLEAAATTALGFLVLVASPVPVVQSYGLVFAVAVMLSFAYSVLVMPVLVHLLLQVTGRSKRAGPTGP
jgi:predicted RND superfamily exporter protein